MEELIRGYRRFRANRWLVERHNLENLARNGQQPHTLAIACSDSRVAPEMIIDASPGEIFSLRNIANLVPPYMPDGAFHGTSAAIEFAIRVLEVKRIAVFGHSSCGGVAALMHGAPTNTWDFVAPWVQIAEPARRRALAAHPHDRDAALRCCEIENVRVSLENLESFPWVKSAREAGKLQLLGFYFDVASGTLHHVETNQVLPIKENDA